MMYFFHYFDKRSGPFKSLTKMSLDTAVQILEQIKAERPNSFCAERDENYIIKRKNCEAKLRELFAEKGGVMDIASPYYMVVGHFPWLESWYESPGVIKIPLDTFDPRKISFTYGDSMPNFAVIDGKEYRGIVYTYDEIQGIIEKYGLPQDWNAEGNFGPERYIEAYVWSEDVIRIERIKWYEALMEEIEKEIEVPTDKIKVLEAYYTSADWKADFEADESGLLPKNLKRGVLSEDGVWNLLSRYNESEE